MAKVKMVKPVSAKGAKLAKVAEPLKPKMENPKQAMQGAMGKAQGYLGHLVGKGPQEALKKPKNKKKGAK